MNTRGPIVSGASRGIGVLVSTLLVPYRKYSRRRSRHAQRLGQRLDLQGLRMVAVLTVFANHLWDWPSGGFIGVDVFFVISGFLITGNLLRDAESRGRVSFRSFYWNRFRRIVPAATVVLVLTVAASYWVYLPFRVREIGVDAAWASVFMSNWWFGYQGTDYFRAAADTESPIQHYWSLSIEEQFYFVWPALIFVVSVLVLRKAWTHRHRMQLAGALMGVIVAASFGWALSQTATDPVWAYFDTFSRVWELGVGALLACATGVLARIPAAARTVLSWAGLGLIAAALVVTSDESAGFPAPWALLPVTGAALVIAAGVDGEPAHQPFLRNPVSGYIGDISYSLYLTHWPVIVILGAMMDPGPYYSCTAIALVFALSVASYHFVENPLRRADRAKLYGALYEIRRRRYRARPASKYAVIAAVSLLAVAGIAYQQRPEAYTQPSSSSPAEVVDVSKADPSEPRQQLGPLTAVLQDEIAVALEATEWPPMDPAMETVLGEALLSSQVAGCYPSADADPRYCDFGAATAPFTIVLVGDSVGAGYAEPLRQLAERSGGQIRLRNQTMASCVFTADLIYRDDLTDTCAARKESAVAMINSTNPDLVVVANSYETERVVGATDDLTVKERQTSQRKIIERFRANAGEVVLLSPPPSNAPIRECYSRRGSAPADCIGRIPKLWNDRADADRELAESIGAVWVDSRPFFCSPGRLCPAFVGSTPARVDEVHMATPYASKIVGPLVESFRARGISLPAEV